MLLDLPTQAALKRTNPWWEGLPQQQLPKSRRHLVAQIQRRLRAKLAPIVVVRGSRQIGKTTAQLQVIKDLLDSGVPKTCILRVQFDDLESLHELPEPILRIIEWFEKEVLCKSLNKAAEDGIPAYLFFDEVQNLDRWADQLKFLVDHTTVQVVVTGSSALRIEKGNDSLAGRVNTIEAGALSLTEIGIIRGMPSPNPYLPDNGIGVLKSIEFWQGLREYGSTHKAFRLETFSQFAERGAYPIAHLRKEASWELVAEQLNETVIQRVIQHDLRLGEKGRKRDAALLEELFRICCRYAGQAPSQKHITSLLNTALGGNIGSQRARAYTDFLSQTLLLWLIQPLEIRLKKRRSSPKICLADHSLRSSWLQAKVPLTNTQTDTNQTLATEAGFLAESITGTLLSTIHGLQVSYLAESNKQPEIDFMLKVGTQHIPIEVKYQNHVDARDLKGLNSFLAKEINEAPFGLVVTKQDEVASNDENIVSLPLSTLMLLR